MEEPKFIEADQQIGGWKDGDSIAAIALWQERNCIKALSAEMRGGYTQVRYHGAKGSTVMSKEETYIPDAREVFGNSVEAFYDVLFPHFPKEFEESTDEIIEELEKIRETFIKKTSADEEEVLHNDHYNDDDKKLLEEYKFKRLRLHRYLFREINKFLKSINYFESVGIEE